MKAVSVQGLGDRTHDTYTSKGITNLLLILGAVLGLDSAITDSSDITTDEADDLAQAVEGHLTHSSIIRPSRLSHRSDLQGHPL